MKKIVSIFLAFILSFSCLTVAFAEDPVYTCPYSKYEYVKGDDGSYSYELVYCGETFSTKAAYDAHVLTCPYHTGSSLEVTLSGVADSFLTLYKADTKIWSIIVPIIIKIVEAVQSLASGESLF